MEKPDKSAWDQEDIGGEIGQADGLATSSGGAS